MADDYNANLARLIAAQEGIRVEDVTVEFLRWQRAWRVYPASRIRLDSNDQQEIYKLPKIFTVSEIEAMEKENENRILNL